MTANGETPRVICFDLGGVIVRICRSWAEACVRAGVGVRDPEEFGRADLAAKRKALVDLYQTGRIGCDEFFDGIAAASGGLYSPGEVRLVHHAWVIEEYPGVRDVVTRLNGVPGIVTACLSNTNHAHWMGMLGEGPGCDSPTLRSLKVKGASQLLGTAKPGREIYKRAETLVEASGGEIVFFDDLMENIEAARSNGWRAFRVNPDGDTAAQIAVYLAGLGMRL